jgi:UDP-N-acetylglucosamine transferase subunit ALG13
MKICLICAPGGHLTEGLKLIESFKKNDEIFLVTYEENFEVNLTQIRQTYFLKNLIIKKVNSSKIVKKIYLMIFMVYLFIKEFFIILKEKPELILSTGSEIALPSFLVAKFFGIKTIFVESLTRINELSGTGKILIHLSDNFLVQWPELSLKHEKAIYKGNLLKYNEDFKNPSEGFILVTVGTASFERLVRMADNVSEILDDKILIQKGRTNYEPKNAEYFDFTKDLKEFEHLISKAKLVISHAGVGTILNVLDNDTPLIIVPRIGRNNEHIDDHQVELANYLNKYSIAKVANDEKDLLNCLNQLNSKQSVGTSKSIKSTKNSLIHYLEEFTTD